MLTHIVSFKDKAEVPRPPGRTIVSAWPVFVP